MQRTHTTHLHSLPGMHDANLPSLATVVHNLHLTNLLLLTNDVRWTNTGNALAICDAFRNEYVDGRIVFSPVVPTDVGCTLSFEPGKRLVGKADGPFLN